MPSVQFVSIAIFRPRANYRYIIYDKIAVAASVTITAVIPNISDIQLEKAEVTAFVDGVPPFVLTPRSTLDPGK